MNRATLVYILMVGLCIAGVWAILKAGSDLRAPPDLSGVWEIEAADARVTGTLGRTITIEQSGRYAEVRFDGGMVMAMKLTDEQPRQTTSMSGDGWTLDAKISPGPRGPTMAANLRGKEAHAFTARLRNGRPSGQSPHH